MKADLMVFDVDGTLAETCKRLTPDMVDILGRLAAHVPVVMSTGRTLGGLAPILDQVDLPGPHVVSNGLALVEDGAISTVVNHLDAAIVDEVLAYLDARRMYAVLGLADGNLHAPYADHLLEEIVEEGAWPVLIGERPDGMAIQKILTICYPEEEGDIRTIGARGAEILRTQYNMVEWMAPGGTKGQALPLQIERLGLHDPYVVAVGDSENDISLLQAASWGVATADAADEVKAIADEIIDGPLDAWLAAQLAT